MSQFVWTFPAGHIKDNYAELGAVATISFVVPIGKIWLVYGGSGERDQNATFSVVRYNSGDKLIQNLSYVAAGTTTHGWPSISGYPTGPFLLQTGDYIKYTWGAAQTSPEVSLAIVEIDAP